MRPLDPRLLDRARPARIALAADAALGLVAALLVLAQAVLLARIAARGFDGTALSALTDSVALLLAVIAARALVAWAFEVTGRRAAAGVLSAGHARALLALEAGPEAQEELAARIVAEGLSVRATEEAVTLANRSDAKTPSAPRRKPIQMPGLQDVAERLSSTFDTRVTVSLGKRKGKIVVEFGSVDDLQRIVDMMNRPAG